MGSLPYIVEDVMGMLKLYSDGTVFRSYTIPFTFPIISDNSITYTDILFDAKRNLHLRIFKPIAAKSNTDVENQLIPIIYFFHGGGFLLGSRTMPNCHNCCLRLASSLDAVVIAPDYRLSPEHRLPAAMDDAVSAVEWLQKQALSGGGAHEWLRSTVDFERVFIAGDSSGGNIVHHLAVREGCGSDQLYPVRVRGYILLAPFFGGVERTRSELVVCEKSMDLEVLDRCWRLALPVGENRDHPLANPFGPASPSLGEVELGPMLVIVGGDEILKDRAEEYAMRLKGLGKKVEYVEFEGKQHGFFTDNPCSQVTEQVLHIIKRFITLHIN